MFLISFTGFEYLNDSPEWIYHHYEWNYMNSTYQMCYFPPPLLHQSFISFGGDAEQRKKNTFLISQKQTLRDKCSKYSVSAHSGGSSATSRY